MQLVSGEGELNARQVSLLWHNSFLVSLWTFYPTLVLLVYELQENPGHDFPKIAFLLLH